jgi:hypothetical protein
MKCPRCGYESLNLMNELNRCRSCDTHWTSWQQRRIEELWRRIRIIWDAYATADMVIDKSRERIAFLESLLREIAEHEHCQIGAGELDMPYTRGACEGHRCAAAIARRAFSDGI